MIKKIFKYGPLKGHSTTVRMPMGADILHVDSQKNEVFVWAIIDPSQPSEDVIFEVYGTGHDISYDFGDGRTYLGTVKIYEESLIFHVFEYTGV